MNHALSRIREFVSLVLLERALARRGAAGLTGVNAESRLRATGESHEMSATDVGAVIFLPAVAPLQQP